jgi:hypothetical protein
MKKIVLGLSLSLVALGFLIPPAMAATSPQSAPELSAFLESLATPVAPVPAAKRPALEGKALCTATAHCASSTISCSGNNSTTSCSSADQNCSVGQRGFVTCDGTTTVCPTACPCPPDYCLNVDCSDQCGGCPYTVTCLPGACSGLCHCQFGRCPQ